MTRVYWRNLREYFNTYSESSSFHGIKFLGEKKRNKLERIFWLIVIVIALIVCFQLISKTYIHWRNSPVMVSFATSETPIWRIPFPAVTICPINKAQQIKYNLSSEKLWTNFNIEDDERFLKYKYISLLCPNIKKHLLQIADNETYGDNAIEFLADVAPNVSTIVESISWFDLQQNDIENFFAPTLTSGGICYTFNMLDRTDIFTDEAAISYYNKVNTTKFPTTQWSLEKGYSGIEDFETYPRRTLLTGTLGGFEILLRSLTEDVSRDCSDITEGFKVMLHQPAEIPRFQRRYFWVPLDQIVSASVKPNMITTSDNLKHYKPEKRKCYFINEKKLQFFKVYNQQNCQLECLSNYTYEMCKCVAIHFPRNHSMPICGPSQQICINRANFAFLTTEAKLQMKENKNQKKTVATYFFSRMFKEMEEPVPPPGIECNCLPSCFYLNFDVETSQLNWNWKDINKYNYQNKSMNLSRLRIYFRDLQFMTSERNELYGEAEFLANCGGLLGLFTGFSIISLVEILYFLTIRLVFNIKKFGWKNWSGTSVEESSVKTFVRSRKVFNLER